MFLRNHKTFYQKLLLVVRERKTHNSFIKLKSNAYKASSVCEGTQNLLAAFSFLQFSESNSSIVIAHYIFFIGE